MIAAGHRWPASLTGLGGVIPFGYPTSPACPKPPT
jgi:hypothetical protein